MQKVKSTIYEALLDALAPHYCCSCGEIGSLLCERCFVDIAQRPFEACVVCAGAAGGVGVCRHCRAFFARAWCAGWHEEVLRQVVSRYKFKFATTGRHVLGELMVARLPALSAHTVVVPIPTSASHVRQRGFDHARLLADYIALRRGLKVSPALKRAVSSQQKHAGRGRRLAQAQAAFRVAGAVFPDRPYLVVDDVVTTGATLNAAARLLKEAGAREVWAVVAARQPLDDKR